MIIALDFDDVVANLVGHFVDTLNKGFGTSYTHDGVRGWDTSQFFSPEHADYMWGPEMFRSRDWTMTIPPVPGSLKGMSSLGLYGHRLAIVSSNLTEVPRGNWINDWLKVRGFMLPVLTSNDRTSKAVLCKQIGADLAIDDAPHNVEALADVVPHVILFDRPWNQGVATGGTSNINRVWNWDQLVGYIQGLAEGNGDQARPRQDQDGPTGAGVS